ncbi:peptide chain release factor N(5)-glutamine methyltransferase [Thermodesulfobacteriota bacterium]
MPKQSQTKESLWTILKLLKWAASYFKSHNIENPRAAAEILLAHALKIRRIDLYLRYDQPLSSHELKLFKTLLKKRIKREPVAYIVGVKEFWSLDLIVTKEVLIPRPETECLVEAVIYHLSKVSGPDPKRILELGTGSGAITLALASQLADPLFFTSDCLIKSVRLAKQNAKRHHLDKRIHFFCGDWLSPLKFNKSFDIIVSNPPYIKTGVIAGLQPEIYLYEPCMALDGGEDGLGSIRNIIADAHAYLDKKGWLFLEMGHDQKDDVLKIIDDCGHYTQVFTKKDYSGYDRVVYMKKNNKNGLRTEL